MTLSAMMALPLPTAMLPTALTTSVSFICGLDFLVDRLMRNNQRIMPFSPFRLQSLGSQCNLAEQFQSAILDKHYIHTCARKLRAHSKLTCLIALTKFYPFSICRCDARHAIRYGIVVDCLRTSEWRHSRLVMRNV